MDRNSFRNVWYFEMVKEGDGLANLCLKRSELLTIELAGSLILELLMLENAPSLEEGVEFWDRLC